LLHELRTGNGERTIWHCTKQAERFGTHAARTGHGKSLVRAPVLERRRLGAQWRRNRGSEPALDGRLREKEIHTGGKRCQDRAAQDKRKVLAGEFKR
jgi:hypothetical protein